VCYNEDNYHQYTAILEDSENALHTLFSEHSDSIQYTFQTEDDIVVYSKLDLVRDSIAEFYFCYFLLVQMHLILFRQLIVLFLHLAWFCYFLLVLWMD